MGKTAETPKPWPKLSEDLAGPVDPRHCQSCGGLGHGLFTGELTRWIEHDEDDKPTAVVVVLCKACADRLVDPHPRLYRPMEEHEPAPGSMPICLDCVHRVGVRCTHPAARANGGRGVELALPRPTHGIACSRGRGRGCQPFILWHGPVTACKQKEPK
jgi:hypothetical protein